MASVCGEAAYVAGAAMLAIAVVLSPAGRRFEAWFLRTFGPEG